MLMSSCRTARSTSCARRSKRRRANEQQSAAHSEGERIETPPRGRRSGDGSCAAGPCAHRVHAVRHRPPPPPPPSYWSYSPRRISLARDGDGLMASRPPPLRPPLPHPLLFSENARPENVIRARAETSSVCVVFVVVWHSGCVWCVTQAQCAILASLPGWGAVWCGAGLGGEPRGRSRTADDRGCGWERRERDSYTHDGEGVRARWFLEGLGEGNL
mmetsp:Transcript_2168/g.5532  ORF Transcript_2168/g.5532 Transcript_2168/m.5532 type:complete len:216 (+) Transcript_2168:856-1503(+)